MASILFYVPNLIGEWVGLTPCVTGSASASHWYDSTSADSRPRVQGTWDCCCCLLLGWSLKSLLSFWSVTVLLLFWTVSVDCTTRSFILTNTVMNAAHNTWELYVCTACICLGRQWMVSVNGSIIVCCTVCSHTLWQCMLVWSGGVTLARRLQMASWFVTFPLMCFRI